MNIGKKSEKLEFKKSTSELKSGLDSISAILNKHGKGTLYFGVKDNGDVCGQQIGKETLRDISRDIRNKIKPECEFEVNIKNAIGGEEFIEVLFKGNRAPYSSDGKYYLRFSDLDRQMTNEELESFFKNKIKNYSEWENDDSGISVDSIDKELLIEIVNEGWENKRIPFKFDNSINILNKFGLLAKNKNNLNNAGNVLLSKKNPILLKLAVFATETKETFIRLEHFQGNIYECINKGITFVLESINWNITLNGNVQRKEEPEIPTKALREIIINAFCHANYDSNTSFEICVYKDRVTIYSPGFFPNGFTPEDFAFGKEEPIMLNPKIINMLFKTCKIESFGYGFENTFKICEKNNVKFKYKNTKNGFKFIFYRKTENNENGEDLSSNEKMILKNIREDNYITAAKLANNINKSQKTVYRAIKKLKEKGFIDRVGDDFSGWWKVLK